MDNVLPAIILFNQNGEMLDVFGQQGRGPTDLIRPWDIEVYENTIFLADAANVLKKIEVVNDTLHYKGSETTKLIAVDICVMNNEIFARTVAPSKDNSDQSHHVIHVFSANTFEYLRSFGKTYQSPIKSTELRLSGMGQVACSEESDTILYTFEYFPHVYAYSGTGKYKWSIQVEPFVGYELVETLEPKQNFRYSTGGDGEAQKITTLTAINDQYILVQTVQSLMQIDEYDAKIRSFIISVSDGSLKFYDGNSNVPFIKSISEKAIYAKKLEKNNLLIFR